MFDLHPTTDRVIALLGGVDDHELGRATPMAGTDLEGLLQHLLGLAVAFRDAAAKLDGPTTNSAPRPASGPLPDAWRDLLVERLGRLAEAWDDPDAWLGTTRAGGVELPGDVCGLVALDEVLLHGWDLAAATGQPYVPTDEEAEAVLPVVTPAEDPEQARREREGVFGEPVPVPEGFSMEDLSASMVKSINSALGTIFVLLAVGALIGSLFLSGTIAAVIYYGAYLGTPQILYILVFVVATGLAYAIGSSFTTIAGGRPVIRGVGAGDGGLAGDHGGGSGLWCVHR